MSSQHPISIPDVSKPITLPTAAAKDDEVYVHVGPWRMKRSYTESSVVLSGTKWPEEKKEEPSFTEFLRKVDEDCVTIDKLAKFDSSDTTTSVMSASPEDSKFHRSSMAVAEESDPPGCTLRFWNHCRAKWTRVVFLLALTGAINMVGLATQFYLFTHVKGTKIWLPEDAPLLHVVAALLATMTMSTGFVITFAWISVYSVSKGAEISSLRILANFVSALVVAVLLTIWTLITVVPMLEHR